MDEHFSLLRIGDKLFSLVQFTRCEGVAIVCGNRTYAYPEGIKDLVADEASIRLVKNPAAVRTIPIGGGKLIFVGLPSDFDERTIQFIVEDLVGDIELASIFDTLCDAGLTTRKPYEFDAGGTGADLLRMKVFSERHRFTIGFESTRCKFIPEDSDRCPGKISECPFVGGREECLSSGGSLFWVSIPV